MLIRLAYSVVGTGAVRAGSFGTGRLAVLVGMLAGCSSVPGAAGTDSTAPASITFPTGRPARPENQPPPISGGTLLITHDGHTIVAADPDRDVIWIADSARRALVAQVPLSTGDEPGRLAEDDAGRVHVALRGAGALVTLDLRSGTVAQRRLLCGAPRGVAFDASRNLIHVVCAGGELVSLPPSGGDGRRHLIEPDLRDVVVRGDRLFVSKFRTAELLEVSAEGQVMARARPLPFTATVGKQSFDNAPGVAYRTRLLEDGSLAMLHQRAASAPVPTNPPDGYGQFSPGPTIGMVQAALTRFTFPDPSSVDLSSALVGPAPPIPSTILPVDFAVSPDGAQVAVVAAGLLRNGPDSILLGSSISRGPLSAFSGDAAFAGSTSMPVSGSASAVAFDASGALVVQVREPAQLRIIDAGGQDIALSLPGGSVTNAGHVDFHLRTPSLIACASCHPEAGEDGRVWTFDPIGPRRTLTVRGGILGTEPFHWDGDQADFAHLTTEVFGKRMAGGPLPDDQVTLLGAWIDAQPALPASPVAGPEQIERGRALFMDARVGCLSCHNGPKLTNNQTVSVGTGTAGEAFQVPSLIAVGLRGPFLHDGCAATLRDRFGPCGGDRHGDVGGLSSAQIDDLVAYLGSL